MSGHAQTGGTIDGAALAIIPGSDTGPLRASGVVGRTFYRLDNDGAVYVYPIPGTERVIASDPGFIAVLLEHGDLLQFDGTGWPRIGNPFDGVTATRTPNRQHDLG